MDGKVLRSKVVDFMEAVRLGDKDDEWVTGFCYAATKIADIIRVLEVKDNANH